MKNKRLCVLSFETLQKGSVLFFHFLKVIYLSENVFHFCDIPEMTEYKRLYSCITRWIQILVHSALD